MNAARDRISSKKKFKTVITSGSFGEGLHLRGSDFDIIYVFKNFEDYENIQPSFNSSIEYFSMDRDDVKPGLLC